MNQEETRTEVSMALTVSGTLEDERKLAGLAAQARGYSDAIAMNSLQLGKVFTEAKTLVQHGAWQDWVEDNAGLSVRTAQNLMAIYARFGTYPELAAVDKTKLVRMLALPEGTEEEFIEKNNVSAMSSREVEEAVRKEREKEYRERAEIESAHRKEMASAEEQKRKLTQELEKAKRVADNWCDQVTQLRNRPPETVIPDDIAEQLAEKDRIIAEQLAEKERIITEARKEIECADAERKSISEDIKRVVEQSQDMRETAKRYMIENEKLSSDIRAKEREILEQQEALKEMQEAYESMRGDLQAAQSTIARGDAERTVSGQIDAEGFLAAVRTFIGLVGQMPYLAGTFSMMDQSDRDAYQAGLDQITDWAEGTRKAMGTLQSFGFVN